MAACSSSESLPTVESVNLERYAGTWYDVAHLPRSFQEGCKCVRAEYKLQDKDRLKLRNYCIDEESGERSVAEGEATPVKRSGNSKLKVQFVPLFTGDYYILSLNESYTYALVGTPDREALWILSRSPEPAANQMKLLLNKAESLGYDTAKMIFTDQSCYRSR